MALSGYNDMLFNKGGGDLNKKKKIRGHAFHMQFLLYYYSTVVLKGLFLNVRFSNDYKLVCTDFICH